MSSDSQRPSDISCYGRGPTFEVQTADQPANSTDGHAGHGTRDRVRQTVSLHGRLSTPLDQLDDSTDLHGAGLTSLATVGLMLALEEAFDIEFPDAMLTRQTFRSIDALVAAVDQLRAR